MCRVGGELGVAHLQRLEHAHDGVATYGALKKAVTDAVVGVLEPVQARYAELAADPAYVMERYAAGEARCRDVTAPVLAAAEAAIGL